MIENWYAKWRKIIKKSTIMWCETVMWLGSVLLFSSCSFVTSPGQSPSITADPSAPTQPPLSQYLHSCTHSTAVRNQTREWPKRALLAYSSQFLDLSSEKWPFRGFILELVFPMSIMTISLSFFFHFLPRGLYWSAEYCKVVLHFGSCDVTEMQRYAVIPA